MINNYNKKHVLFITGASGYVGGMLCDQLAKRDDVEKIIGLDIEEKPEFLRDNPKLIWVKANTADQAWESEVAGHEPTTLIHTAWHIREMYGKRKKQWRWNVEGSRHVFSFAFQAPSIQKVIYFSTASIYGAYKTNTVLHRFTENEPMREEEYSYGREKKKVEEILRDIHERAKGRKAHTPQVSIVRPAALTGPRGRFMRIRFGLQSALSGQLKGNFFYRIISFMVSYVPATPWWVRQFIHEDDVSDIVELLAFGDKVVHDYEIFNITPPGKPVFAEQMAVAVGKKVLPIRPFMVRMAFFVFWHVSRGKIPNGPGVWRFYSYPVVLNGEKLTKKYGYQYKFNSFDAFQFTSGRYESYVPKEKRKHKL